MKKKWLIGILSGLCTLTCMVGFSSCGHTHAFDKEITESAYQATQATCTQKESYYYSCECGEKGTETFEIGELLPHEFVNGLCTCQEGVSVGLEYELSEDETYYIVKGFGTCTDTEIVIP